MKKFKFQSENFVVDYFTLNIENLQNVEPIAHYFFQELHFKVTVLKKINHRWEPKGFYFDGRNKFQVEFRQYQYDPSFQNFWVGTQIILKGPNAAQFYRILQTKKFPWEMFETEHFNLGRFDLHYLRTPKLIDSNYPLKLFVEKCCQKIRAKSKRRNISCRETSKGLLLKIGSRKSSTHYRIYTKTNGLEFEIEMRKGSLQQFQKLLFSNRLEGFEDELSKYFYNYSLNLLTIDTPYTDWLVDYCRKLSERQESNLCLVTDYLQKSHLNSLDRRNFLFQLLQFLTFLRRFKGVREYLVDQPYYIITFRVSDFLKFLKVGGDRQYQLQKTLTFLRSLQKLDPIVEFSDVLFRSYVAFPYTFVEKQGKFWVVTIAIAEPLYFYGYPFFFPPEFLLSHDKYETDVKLQLIQSMSTNSLRKRFDVEDFLQEYVISNKTRTRIKNLIIQLFHELKNCELIEPKFELFTKKGSSILVKELTPLLVSQSTYIYFYETRNFRI